MKKLNKYEVFETKNCVKCYTQYANVLTGHVNLILPYGFIIVSARWCNNCRKIIKHTVNPLFNNFPGYCGKWNKKMGLIPMKSKLYKQVALYLLNLETTSKNKYIINI